MIKKNGDNKWHIDIGMFLQVVVILGGVFLFWYNTNGTILAAISDIKVTLGENKVKIDNNQGDIKEIKGWLKP